MTPCRNALDGCKRDVVREGMECGPCWLDRVFSHPGEVATVAHGCEAAEAIDHLWDDRGEFAFDND